METFQILSCRFIMMTEIKDNGSNCTTLYRYNHDHLRIIHRIRSVQCGGVLSQLDNMGPHHSNRWNPLTFLTPSTSQSQCVVIVAAERGHGRQQGNQTGTVGERELRISLANQSLLPHQSAAIGVLSETVLFPGSTEADASFHTTC